MVTDAGRARQRALGAGTQVPEDSRVVEALLTDSTGGTANDTLVAISGSGADAAINDNFADLAAKVNALLQDQHDRGGFDPS